MKKYQIMGDLIAGALAKKDLQIMNTMPKSQARAKARKYSRQYSGFWYVREVSPGQFAPWAHHSDDERTVATFYCGKKWSEA